MRRPEWRSDPSGRMALALELPEWRREAWLWEVRGGNRVMERFMPNHPGIRAAKVLVGITERRIPLSRREDQARRVRETIKVLRDLTRTRSG